MNWLYSTYLNPTILQNLRIAYQEDDKWYIDKFEIIPKLVGEVTLLANHQPLWNRDETLYKS